MKWNYVIISIITISAPVIVISASLYFYQFGDSGLSENHSRWAEFGGFFGAVFALSTTLMSLVIAIFATIILPNQYRKQSKNEFSKQELSRLAIKFYSRDFYIYIMAPAWACATKWLGWSSEDGDAYRADVIGGRYLFKMHEFETIEEANKVPFQNKIVKIGHYQSFQYSSLDEMVNEHMIITMWFAFWEELAFLVSSGIIDPEVAKSRFKVQYVYWIDFHQQYWISARLLSVNNVIEDWEDIKIDPSDNQLMHSLPYLESIFFEKEFLSNTFKLNLTNAKNIVEKINNKIE